MTQRTTLISPPATPLASAADLRDYARLDSDADLTGLAALIEAARGLIEAHTSMALGVSTWRHFEEPTRTARTPEPERFRYSTANIGYSSAFRLPVFASQPVHTLFERGVVLRREPIVSILSVEIVGEDASRFELDPETYYLAPDRRSVRARYSGGLPTVGGDDWVEVLYTAGISAGSEFEALRLAVLDQATWMRDSAGRNMADGRLSDLAEQICQQFRVYRL